MLKRKIRREMIDEALRHVCLERDWLRAGKEGDDIAVRIRSVLCVREFVFSFHVRADVHFSAVFANAVADEAGFGDEAFGGCFEAEV